MSKQKQSLDQIAQENKSLKASLQEKCDKTDSCQVFLLQGQGRCENA